ncbi:MAG: DUF2029 domain-containing protein [Deltaproteobacteria bacterium]|nr:DUF2029 domain-containing protein [Deltaproteobacteria bacterium]
MNILGLEIEDVACDGTFNRHISILLVLLLGFTAANYLYNGVFRPLFTEKIDFEAYYNGAMAFRYKAPIYQTMVDFFKLGPARYEGPLPFVYPPSLAIFLSPLAYLSFNTATFVWLFINQCLFFSGVYLLLRTISRKYSPIEAVVMIFVFMNFTPLFVDYLVGQCNGILFFFITAGLYCYRSHKPVYAGVVIALACAMKVIPMLLLFYALWKRQFKVFLAGSVTLGLIFGYCLLFFDIRLLTWYVKFMMSQTLLNAFHDNHSLTGFFSRFLTHSIWVKGVFDSPTASGACVIISSLLVLGVFLFSTRKRTQPTDPITLREYALAVITMLLLSKMATTLYLVMLLLPLGIMVKDMMDQAVSRKWLFFLIPTYAILAFWYPLPAGKFLKMDNYGVLLEGFPAILLSIQFFAVVVLWCYFAFGGKARLTKPEEENTQITQ